jgi:hypothetical protein
MPDLEFIFANKGLEPHDAAIIIHVLEYKHVPLAPLKRKLDINFHNLHMDEKYIALCIWFSCGIAIQKSFYFFCKITMFLVCSYMY